MRTSLKPVFLIPVFLILSDAVTAGKSPASAYWESRWRDLCEYSKSDETIDWCHWLKTKNGEWIEPSPEILEVLTASKEFIHAVSTLYQVDARAIAGSILAENTLNVDIVDDIQSILVKLKITPTADFLGKKFSIGFGQVNMNAAISAESTAAQIERRSVRSPEKIAEVLLTPAGAICYVAAILRKSQDAYHKVGLEISDRPEILATLFNLGYPEDKAEYSAKLNRKPRVNYFGFFVEKYMKQIEKAVAKEHRWRFRKIATQNPTEQAKPSICPL